LGWHDTVIARLSGEENMPTSRLVQWGAIGGVIAGPAWVASGVVAFVFPGEGSGPVGSTSSNLIESAHAIAAVGMLAWLVGLNARQAPGYGRLGTASFVAAFVGTALVLVSILLVLTTGDRLGETVLTAIFGSGWLLGWLVGFTLLGIATFRAKVLPRWYGLLIIAQFPLVAFAASSYDVGGTLFGLFWLVLGYALWTRRDTPTEQPSRLR
jgi:hypothetical protein